MFSGQVCIGPVACQIYLPSFTTVARAKFAFEGAAAEKFMLPPICTGNDVVGCIMKDPMGCIMVEAGWTMAPMVVAGWTGI
jgi:hypothetical protein